MSSSSATALAVLAFLAGAVGARAAVTISAAPTHHVSCVAGVCRPTHANAILNAGQLQAMLSQGSVTVMSGAAAREIAVVAPLTWHGGVTLTLDANTSVSVRAPLTVTGTGGLTVVTGERRGGVFSIGGRGHVTFAGLSSPLTINGQTFQLVNSLPMLASAIAANPHGLFALSNSYDARPDGVYDGPPVGAIFYGGFDGLGNTISRLRMVSTSSYGSLFYKFSGTTLQHLHLEDVDVRTHRNSTRVLGGLVGYLGGTLFEDTISGRVEAGQGAMIGGLVGIDAGTVENCRADVAVTAGSNSFVGGLVGELLKGVSNSYATGPVTMDIQSSGGGLIGLSLTGSSLTRSYSTGAVTGQAGDKVGGLIGDDSSTGVRDTYWDTSTSGVTSPHQGAGRPLDDAGVTGLTTAQLQAGLPAGFDPTVWGEDPGINGGLPYLLRDPPL